MLSYIYVRFWFVIQLTNVIIINGISFPSIYGHIQALSRSSSDQRIVGNKSDGEKKKLVMKKKKMMMKNYLHSI